MAKQTPKAAMAQALINKLKSIVITCIVVRTVATGIVLPGNSYKDNFNILYRSRDSTGYYIVTSDV